MEIQFKTITNTNYACSRSVINVFHCFFASLKALFCNTFSSSTSLCLVLLSEFFSSASACALKNIDAGDEGLIPLSDIPGSKNLIGILCTNLEEFVNHKVDLVLLALSNKWRGYLKFLSHNSH